MVDNHFSSSTRMLEDQSDHTPSAFMQRKRACHTALLAFIYLEGHPLAIGRNIKACLPVFWALPSMWRTGWKKHIQKLCQLATYGAGGFRSKFPSSEISTLNKRRNVSIICIFLLVWSHPTQVMPTGKIIASDGAQKKPFQACL